MKEKVVHANLLREQNNAESFFFNYEKFFFILRNRFQVTEHSCCGSLLNYFGYYQIYYVLD